MLISNYHVSTLNFLNCLRPPTYLPPSVQSSCLTSLDKALIVIRSCRETQSPSRWTLWFTSTSSRRSWLSVVWTTTGQCHCRIESVRQTESLNIHPGILLLFVIRYSLCEYDWVTWNMFRTWLILV